MAMIHEMLYQSKNLTHINFTDYIQRLVSQLISSYPIKDNITPIIETDDINLNIETATPLGLIINEIVSNSIKYAFPHDKTGKISIKLKYYDDKYKLTISDNGVGFPENLDFRNIESTLGLKLVNSLVKQLDGSIDLDTSQGTKFTIKFKELKYKKRI
jgi:two-component sensor histidine kinase